MVAPSAAGRDGPGLDPRLPAIAAGDCRPGGLIAYPFLYAIYLSLQNKPIGAPGTFVGVQNFLTLWRSPTFYQVIRNTR
jgi:hypothetical protein